MNHQPVKVAVEDNISSDDGSDRSFNGTSTSQSFNIYSNTSKQTNLYSIFSSSNESESGKDNSIVHSESGKVGKNIS